MTSKQVTQLEVWITLWAALILFHTVESSFMKVFLLLLAVVCLIARITKYHD